MNLNEAILQLRKKMKPFWAHKEKESLNVLLYKSLNEAIFQSKMAPFFSRKQLTSTNGFQSRA